MIGSDEIKAMVTEAIHGLVEGAGPPTAAPEVIHDPAGDGELVAVREGYSLEKLDGERVRARRHVFTDVTSFAQFIADRADAECDILVSEKVITGDFEPGERSADVVSCELVLHPRAQRWVDVLGKKVDQKTLLRLVTSAQEDFKTQEGSKVTEGQALALQLMKIEVVKGGNFVSQIDELGTMRFQANSDKADVSGSIPPIVTVRVPIHPGIIDAEGEEIFHDLDLHVELDASDGVAFTLRCPNLAVVMREALLDVVAQVERILGEEYLVGLGRHATFETPTFGERER